MTGSLNVTGTAERPVMVFPPIADYGGALQAATEILGALIGREHGGGGFGAFLAGLRINPGRSGCGRSGDEADARR